MSRTRIVLAVGRAALVVGLALAAGLAVGATAAVAAPPSNDAFASRTMLTGESGSVVGSNLEATREPGEPAHGGEGGPSVWFSWVAPATRRMVFETCGSAFDTVLAVYTGDDLAALERVVDSDDGCAVQSRVIFEAVANTVYSIVIDGYDPDAAGSFTLRWRPITSPPHDDFDAAQPLSGARGVHASSTLGAGNEPGERRHAGSNNGSVWFAWTAPAAGTVSLDTCASSFQTALAVYTGDSMATLTEVASDDDTCGGRARARFETGAGTAYRIAIASDGADVGGDLVLSWVVTRAPANAQWRTPRRLRGLRGALNTSNEGVVAGAPDHAAVWFIWRAPRTMGVSFDTCSGGNLDATLAVYRGRVPRGAAGVDRSDAGCDSEGSRLAFFARRGVDYLISVDGSRAAWGPFTLRWAQAGPAAGTCDVPDIRGLTLARATRQLELQDCTLGRVVPLRSAIVPRGRVIAQFPLPNARLRFLGRVHVEISSG